MDSSWALAGPKIRAPDGGRDRNSVEGKAQWNSNILELAPSSRPREQGSFGFLLGRTSNTVRRKIFFAG